MRMMYPLGTQTSAMQNKIFEAQKNIMRFLAERESCIIVGRCSDFIFAKIPTVSIFTSMLPMKPVWKTALIR